MTTGTSTGTSTNAFIYREAGPVAREYQARTIEWLTHHPRAIIAHSPRLGKTLCAIRALHDPRTFIRYPTPHPFPVLVVCCRRTALRAWRYENLPTIDPHAHVSLYAGTPTQRRKILRDPLLRSGYILVTHSLLQEFLDHTSLYWPIVIVDEGHVIANRRTKWFKTLHQLASTVLWWITATPVRNGAQDLWTALNLLNPHDPQIGAYWPFVQKYCHVEQSQFGADVFGIKDPKALRRLLQNYMIRTTRDQVKDQFPPKTRTPAYTEMGPSQRALYEQLSEEMMVDWEDGTTLLVPSKLALLTRLRQTLITPALYGGPPASGALEDLGEWLSEDFNSDLPALVLTPFAKAIPHIQRLAQKLGAHYYFFQGGMSEKAFNAQIDGFQQNPHTNKLLVGTIRSAASFSASQARVVYMLGYDMVPAENEQAEERGDSPKGLDIRYIMNKGTMDEHILAILNGKQMWSDIALDPHRLLHPPREE